jgi:hypothetical protein
LRREKIDYGYGNETVNPNEPFHSSFFLNWMEIDDFLLRQFGGGRKT